MRVQFSSDYVQYNILYCQECVLIQRLESHLYILVKTIYLLSINNLFSYRKSKCGSRFINIINI